MAHLRVDLMTYFCSLTAAMLTTSVSAARTVKLSSGYDMDLVGFGTWQIDANNIDGILSTALENGYRHIDTAWAYQNEAAIGKTLRKWFNKGNKREDIFVTTKLPPYGNRAADVEMYLKDSLKNLGLNYVDMYLIHFPMGFIRQKDSLNVEKNADGSRKIDYNTDHISIWKAMEAQVKAGRAKSIGLSNFNQTQIQNIIDSAEIKPSNIQVELQIYNQQKQLRNFCKKNKIRITAYSPLGSGGTGAFIKTESYMSLPKPTKNPIVLKIAKVHNRTAAQILLRHAVQEDIIVIPKSTKSNHMKENINIFDFELSVDEKKELDALDKGAKGMLLDFSKDMKGIKKHPLYPWSAQ